MTELLKKLCLIDSPSGNESSVANFIKKEIEGYADYHTDSLGNIIVYKKGKNKSVNKLMIDAHTDEVGMIITSITEEGFLKFETLGGINAPILLCRQVMIEGKIPGVIGCKPIHLCKGEEKEKAPEEESLYIDIGANSKEEAESKVRIGDTATFISDFTLMGNNIKAKAIDDRAGCAVLISLLKEDSVYDYYATFTVQEEVGLIGARCAAYTVSPDFAICLEATTAADIDGVKREDAVCYLGKGPAVSFMDRSTLYDRELYNTAMGSSIPCQPKSAVTGGNNSGAIHLTRDGIRTLAISLPCRYIHSPSCVANISDLENTKKLTKYMIEKICSGEIK